MKNHYAILGISESATADEIKVAYRLNAKKYHPDMNAGNESYRARFVEVQQAYEILSRPDSRAQYDAEFAARRAAATQTRAQTARQQTARPFAGNGQAQRGYAPPPPPNNAYSRPATPPPPPPQDDGALVEQAERFKRRHLAVVQKLKEEHEVQLELARVSAHEELLKFKLASKRRLEVLKKKMAEDRKKIRGRYHAAINGFALKLKRYKQNIKRSVYHKGMKDGIKSAQDSAMRAAEEIKAAASAARDSGQAARVEGLQSELKLIQEKNNELMRQIALVEQLSAAENADCDRTEQLAEKAVVEDAADAVAAERDALALKLQEQEEEIDRLNDEVLRLESMLEAWKEAAADGVITAAELAAIRAYEDRQLEQSKGTWYGTLGLYLNALPEEIDRAFDKLSRRYSGKDEYLERFMEIAEAYEVLSDPRLKADYDASIGNSTEL